MCSIVCAFAPHSDHNCLSVRDDALERSHRQHHRGPDSHGIYADARAVLVHERLAIVDPHGGAQPLLSSDGNLVLAINGEIYNHLDIRNDPRYAYSYLTSSDCEVVNALYGHDDPEVFLNRLNGIFAFALWDRRRGRALIARDPIGVCPLYWGRDAHGRLWVSSEMKGLVDLCADVALFPPGHFYDSLRGELVRYYHRPWRSYANVRDNVVTSGELRAAFEGAVERQLMSAVPSGVLLSGGLDSSLVAACAARSVRSQQADASPLTTFAIGLEGSADLAAATIVSEALGTAHCAVEYTVQQGLDVLAQVIRHIETYDVATVRSSVPMYLLARRIRSTGVKMVLSGEGSDEIFGGYLYFRKAPSAEALHDETVRKLDALHLNDCLRANKALLAWGVETRVPFLDREFLDVAMRMNPETKRSDRVRMEKTALREAFADVLPESILWRRKEQLSDGMGSAWIDGLKRHAAELISAREMDEAQRRFPINSPHTPEALLYRKLFERFFPGRAAAQTVPGGKSIACSSPQAMLWDPRFASLADPSGRSMLAMLDTAAEPS